MELQNFRFIEVLNQSRRAEIRKVKNKQSGELFVIKIVKTGEKDSIGEDDPRFDVWRNLKSLRHSNIASIHDFTIDSENNLCILMEYIHGYSLHQKIRKREEISFSRWADYMIRAASGLRGAYYKDLVHCDIKPSNLLINREDILKIVDFGLGAFFRRSETAVNYNRDSISGTPEYMSPEQCSGRNLDHRSDIYSLGASFYHCLTGRPPFEGDTVKEIVRRHISQAPLSPAKINSGIPEEFSNIIEKCLSKDPAERFEDYSELIEDLEEVKLHCISREKKPEMSINSFSVHDNNAPIPRFTGRSEGEKESAKKRRNIYLGIILVIIVIVITGLVYRTGRRSSRRGAEFKKIFREGIMKDSPVEGVKELSDNYQKTLGKMRELAREARKYKKDRGTYPTDIKELKLKGYGKIGLFRDAWGNFFILNREEGVIASPGPDGKTGTEDDLAFLFHL